MWLLFDSCYPKTFVYVRAAAAKPGASPPIAGVTKRIVKVDGATAPGAPDAAADDEAGVSRFTIEEHPGMCCKPCQRTCACSTITPALSDAVTVTESMAKAEAAWLKKANGATSAIKEKWSIVLSVIIAIVIVIIAQATAGGLSVNIFNSIWSASGTASNFLVGAVAGFLAPYAHQLFTLCYNGSQRIKALGE